MSRLAILCLSLAALAPGTAFSEEDHVTVTTPGAGDSSAWNLRNSDRLFIITQQADTMQPMTFRVGTAGQLQTVDAGRGNNWGSGAGFSGYNASLFADFAPLSWLQLGVTMGYGSLGDPATVNLPAPTAYVKAQFLKQDAHGVNMAAAVNVKKIGFSRPTDQNPNAGEIEAQIMVDRRIGDFVLSLNGVFGKSFTAPDSDAEVKLAAGYRVLKNLLVGVDALARFDSSLDGGPRDGTRYVELTGGGIVTWKIWNIGVSALAGVAAPMHTPLGYVGVGATGMLQVAYTPW